MLSEWVDETCYVIGPRPVKCGRQGEALTQLFCLCGRLTHLARESTAPIWAPRPPPILRVPEDPRVVGGKLMLVPVAAAQSTVSYVYKSTIQPQQRDPLRIGLAKKSTPCIRGTTTTK